MEWKEACESGIEKKLTGLGEGLVEEMGKRKNQLWFQSFVPELGGDCGAAVRIRDPGRGWFGGKDDELIFKPVDWRRFQAIQVEEPWSSCECGTTL